ncbi:golgin subfamily A member 1 isoform X2 [Latimeria chalumnae]|uniref:golgin subfamily A member 1 isoform X2 n=1 Tax=Latimeria chalumnae TaxID=7897 RepID=UPI00313D1E26
MFAKLKKKIAEEAATAPRPGSAARIPRSVSKESITSAGADSGDDFGSDGSSSREDLSSQLLRRNDQVRKLEAKLSASMRKLQEQNETYQVSKTKMAEGMALTIEKKDQEWKEKIADLEKEKEMLTTQLQEMKERSLNLFQKRDEIDELEGFQQQELAKVKHMLLRKEESLAKAEQKLEEQSKEIQRTKEELQVTNERLLVLDKKVQHFENQQSMLEKDRGELLAIKMGAESKIAELEQRGQDLQKITQQLSSDLIKAQSSATALKKTLSALQTEYESFKLQHEQYKQKTIVEVEEKDKFIAHLQEKVSSLSRRIEGNFSEDEHLQELLRERVTLEQKLEDTRQQLVEARTSHSQIVSVLETQISKLNSKTAELSTLLKHKEEATQTFKENSTSQIQELEHNLQILGEKLKKAEEENADKEAHIKKLHADQELENRKLHQHVATVRRQSTKRINRLEAQISALETAREFDKTAAQHKITQLEQENGELLEKTNEVEKIIKDQENELERSKTELSSRETVSVEIAKALEETRKQREELQQQVVKLTELLNEKNQSLSQKAAEMTKKEDEMSQLKQECEAASLQVQQLQTEIEMHKNATAEREGVAEKQLNALKLEVLEQQKLLEASQRRVLDLEGEVKALNEQLHPPEDTAKEQNGEVAAADVVVLQKENWDLEQQIVEKNKTIKQLQQRMVELRKTLQKELKIRPEPEEAKERPNCEPPYTVTASTTVTNTSDLNDSREINFEYLKHVVLKFMSCREAEAFHLIKAVSVLLNFTREEENMLKETLEYKMSWFGSKPAPKGIIRPSISGSPTLWH